MFVIIYCVPSIFKYLLWRRSVSIKFGYKRQGPFYISNLFSVKQRLTGRVVLLFQFLNNNLSIFSTSEMGD